MKFINYVKYISDSRRVEDVRPRHREYMAQLTAAKSLFSAGPFGDLSGALFIYEAGTLSEAEALFANDPYRIEGVVASFEITQWQLLSLNKDLLD
jgi:uncharacterized protein YciI